MKKKYVFKALYNFLLYINAFFFNRPGQSGQDANFGFQLPVDRAPKAGEETLQGILAFLRAI